MSGEHTFSGKSTQLAQGTAAPVLKVGELFGGRYKIERLLGQGGMGSVFKARDLNTDEEVCLKLVRPDLTSQREIVERFRKEGKLARRLTHEGAVKVFDIDQRDGYWFISMEYVEGRSLREWMKLRKAKGKRIHWEEAVWIARQILQVLEHAHQLLIHCDIKPENILIAGEPRHSGCKVKLLDFGIARALTDGVSRQTRTIVGTPAYMAPEQKSGDAVDARTDLYAVACVLYELICGVAYDGNWEAPSEAVEGCPTWLDDVIRSALSKFPDKRPADAKALLNKLSPQANAQRVKQLASSWSNARRAGTVFEDWFKTAKPNVDSDLQFAADAGDPTALTLLGRCLYFGCGVAQDYEGAFESWEAAASLGNAEAMYNLGRCYRLGRGVSKSSKKAHKWFQRAAELNDVAAAFMLGKAYLRGTGTDQDLDKARLWLEKAKEAGHSKASSELDKLDEAGEEDDSLELDHDLVQAANDGDLEAQYALAQQLEAGEDGTPDEQEAIKWYARAAQGGHADAQVAMGLAHSTGEGQIKNERVASQWYEKAAAQGHADAQWLLGAQYRDGRGVNQDYERAAALFKASAKSGSPEGQFLLACCYLEGQGVPENKERAARLFMKSAEQGDSDAQYMLGCCLENGEGVSEDAQQAAYWFRKAAAAGNDDARQALEKLAGSNRLPELEAETDQEDDTLGAAKAEVEGTDLGICPECGNNSFQPNGICGGCGHQLKSNHPAEPTHSKDHGAQKDDLSKVVFGLVAFACLVGLIDFTWRIRYAPSIALLALLSAGAYAAFRGSQSKNAEAVERWFQTGCVGTLAFLYLCYLFFRWVAF